MGFKWDNFQDFRRKVAADMQRIAVCLQKEMFSTADKGLKMMSSLKTLQDELREEVSQKNAVRIKRRLSEEVPVAPSFEAARNVKSPMK